MWNGYFQNPILLPPEGSQNFTELGNICPQIDDLNMATQVLGNEDCLVLNIYTPSSGSIGAENRFPVLVFVHGGSFAVGSSTSDLLGVDLLIDSVRL